MSGIAGSGGGGWGVVSPQKGSSTTGVKVSQVEEPGNKNLLPFNIAEKRDRKGVREIS